MTDNTKEPGDAQAKPAAEGEQPPPSSSSSSIGDVTGEKVNLFQAQTQTVLIHLGDLTGLSLDGLTELSRGIRDNLPGAASGTLRQIIEQYGSAHEDTSVGGDLHVGDQPTAPPPEGMPETEQQIDDWYRRLTERERCFVRATAILHGAPAYHVTRSADELFTEVSRRKPKSPKGQHTGSPTEADGSNRDLLQHTYTVTREAGGVRRLYWQDADAVGYSAFGLKVLRLIAYEIEGTAGQAGCDVQAWAESCAQSGKREVAWRAARALGVVWWRLDRPNLKHTAQLWATRSAGTAQQAAAGLLYGAFEIEHSESPVTQANDPAPVVSRILRQLTQEARQGDRGAGMARTLATAYNLISRRWPVSALEGLERMLRLTSTESLVSDQQNTLDIFISATLGYVQIAWFGNVRLVLSRLSEHAERLARPTSAQGHPSEVKVARDERERQLAAIFFIFFFLVASSLAGADRKHSEVYEGSGPLGDRPTIPDSNGRDVLLAGILAGEEAELRAHVEILLSVAFITGHAVTAGSVLRQWAQLLAAGTSEQSRVVRVRYVQFAVHIGRRLAQWDEEFGLSGLRAGSAAYKSQLKQWPGDAKSKEIAEVIRDRLGYD